MVPNHYPIWVDGVLQANQALALAVNDAGLQFGLGLFETTRTFARRPWAWEEHLARLCQSSPMLGIAIDPIQLPDEQAVQAYCLRLGITDLAIRLNMTPGAGANVPRVWMTARPLPTPTAGLRLTICPWRVAELDPLSAIKSFNYGLRRLADERAMRAGFDSALLIGSSGRVLEGAWGNLFMRTPQGWITPTLDGGVLPGIVRRKILQHAEILQVREANLECHRLSCVGSAFLTNSVRGLVPIASLDDVPLRVDEAFVMQLDRLRQAMGFGASEDG